MADTARSSMDDAKYEHVLLGLTLLNYISDAFEERHAQMLPEWGEEGDENIEKMGFCVPREARRARVEAGARQPTVGRTIGRAAA